jgi:hypothetical protein
MTSRYKGDRGHLSKLYLKTQLGVVGEIIAKQGRERAGEAGFLPRPALFCF